MIKNEPNYSRYILQKLLFSGERLSKEELTAIFHNQEIKEKLLTYYFVYRATTSYNNNKDNLDLEIVIFIKNFLYKDLLKTNNPDEIMLLEDESNFDNKIAEFEYLETSNGGSTYVDSTRFTLNLSKTNTTLVGKWINTWKTEIKNDYDKIENQEDAIHTTIRRLVGEGDKDALNSAIKLKNSSLAESEQTALQKRNSISIRSFNDATEHLKIMEEQCNRFAKNFLLQTEVLSPETMKEYLVKHFDKLIEANKTKR